MKTATRSLPKSFALAALSNFTLESLSYVDELVVDGRANVVNEQPEQPGGLAYYSTAGIRYFDRQASLALAGLIGDEDQEPVRALLHPLGITSVLPPVTGKTTNRSQVLLDRHENRLILRRQHQIQFGHDLQPQHQGLFLDMIRRSTGCLLGNLPLAITVELLAYGKRTGTYMGLVPGGNQLGHLADLQPHALFLNAAEARQATGVEDLTGERLFDRLLAVTPASHVVVMTDGARPIHVAERAGRGRWVLEPVDITPRLYQPGFPNALGAGDVLAGTATFLLGQLGPQATGEMVREVIAFAQEVATAHVSSEGSLLRSLPARYAEFRRQLATPIQGLDQVGEVA